MNKDIIVLSDIHFPYEDRNALNAIYMFLQRNPVDIIVLNGDIIDMYDVSTFDKSPARINSLQKELNKAYKFFQKLRVLCPKAEIYFIRGNHEYRLERYLYKHPELYSLEALKLPNLLKLNDFDIKYREKFLQLGNLKITHGSIVRKFSSYTAHAELDKNDCSGISGHTHRGGVCYKQTPSRYLVWYEGFCLCDIHPEYVDNPDWQQGFLYGSVSKNKFSIIPVPIINGKTMSIY